MPWFGFVPAEAVPLVAHALNLTRAEIHGVVSFYHEYRRHKPGRHVLRLCCAEACQALGCESLADHVRSRLNIAWHETTSDGAVTLEPVFCLGLCAIGRAALLDGQPLAHLDQARIETALDRPAYNYIIHTSPFDTQALPHYHWHMEIIPRTTRIAGFEWGTGFYINAVPPEQAAAYLREVEVDVTSGRK